MNKLINIFEELTNNCDGCKYFDMDDLSHLGAYEKPIYYMIQKGLIEEMIYMSPEEYIKNISRNAKLTRDEILGSAYRDETASKYAINMKNGDKFPLPYYTEGEAMQEGRHRVMATIKLGAKVIPVIRRSKVDWDYGRDFVIQHKDFDSDMLNKYFIDKGYKGITQLDWNTFKQYKENRL